MRVKKLLFICLAVVAAVVVAAAAVLSTVDFGSRFKGLVAGAAEQATGRRLAMNGPVKLSLLPVPSLTVTDVALANAPGASDPEMLRLGELSARVEVLPLLLGRGLHIERLLLKDVTLRLETDAKGRGNWEFGVPAASAPAAGGGGLDLAAIGEVRLENLTLAWRDDRAGKTLTGSVRQLMLTEAPDGSLAMTAAALLQNTPVTVAATLGALGTQPYPIAVVVTAADGKAVLQGSVAEPMAGRGVDLAVALDGADLGKLGTMAGATLPAKPYHLAAKLTGDAGGALALTGLQASLGASTLAGELHLTTTGTRPRLTAQIEAKLLDLTELLPPPIAAPAAPDDDRVFSNDPLPFPALAGFDADVGLRVAEMRAAAMTVRNLAVQATLDDRELHVASFALDLPAGHADGRAAALTRQPPASVELTLDARQLDLGELLAQLAGTDLLAAKGDVAVAVTGRGDSVRAIMATLNGTASLQAGRGIIRSRYADLVGADVFREAFAWAKGKNDVALNCVVARFDVRNGTATVRGLLLDSDLVTVSGSGTINLGTERLALQVVPKPKDTSLLNLATPIDIGGRLNHPAFTPNRAALAKDVAIGVASTVNPLFALVPMVLDRGGDTNSCAASLEGKPAAAPASPAQQLNKTLKNLLQ